MRPELLRLLKRGTQINGDYDPVAEAEAILADAALAAA